MHLRTIRHRLRLPLGGILLTLSVAAQADIYRCNGTDGVPLFTNIPNDQRCMVVIKAKVATPNPVAALVQDRSARRIGRVVRDRYDEHVQAAARQHNVEPALIHAVISAESAYNPLAKSSKGARGLMQLVPETAARYGVTDMLDPKQNIDGGTRYLRDLLAMFGSDLRLVIAAYNAGEGAVQRYGSIPPYAETRNYVPKVLAYYQRYRAAATATAATTSRIVRVARAG
jgi:soluble lytic murein transglycosylase-like protein